MTIPLRAFDPDRAPDPPPPDPVRAEPPRFIASVQGVIDLYIEHLRARVAKGEFTDDSRQRIEYELTRFAGKFGHLSIAACKQYDLTLWFDLHPRWKAPDQLKRIAATIVGCFAWAFGEGLIERCPYTRPRFLKGMKSKVRRPAAAGEYVMLMRKGSRPLRRALFMLRRTGIRPKEMRDLVWPEVHLDGDMPYIDLEKHKSRGKTGKPRKIGLDNATANFLRALRRNQRGQTKGDRVFVNKRGTPWDRHTFARHLRRFADRLGIDEGVAERVSAYGLRHKWVVDGIRGGVTTRRLADNAGHETTKMIDTVYGSSTRDDPEHLHEVAEEVLRKRPRRKLPKVEKPQRDGYQQGNLFPE
jgi:integrase/recombinase XerD